MRLIFASNNNHKLSEMKSILGDKYSIFLYSLNDFDIHIDPDEAGTTFKENADIKSKATYTALKEKGELKVGDFIFSDDTGLCIDYFDGAPGIYSARFMGDISQLEKNKKIIKELENISDEKRSAYFETCVSVIEIRLDKDIIDMPEPLHFIGKVDGYIAKTLEGEEGFGYDPIFVVKEYMESLADFSKTYAKLGSETKNRISHRAKAMASFVAYLEKNHKI